MVAWSSKRDERRKPVIRDVRRVTRETLVEEAVRLLPWWQVLCFYTEPLVLPARGVFMPDKQPEQGVVLPKNWPLLVVAVLVGLVIITIGTYTSSSQAPASLPSPTPLKTTQTIPEKKPHFQ